MRGNSGESSESKVRLSEELSELLGSGERREKGKEKERERRV